MLLSLRRLLLHLTQRLGKLVRVLLGRRGLLLGAFANGKKHHRDTEVKAPSACLPGLTVRVHKPLYTPLQHPAVKRAYRLCWPPSLEFLGLVLGAWRESTKGARDTWWG